MLLKSNLRNYSMNNKLFSFSLCGLMLLGQSLSVNANDNDQTQSMFKSPNHAISSLLEALKVNNHELLVRILGGESRQVLETPDKAAETAIRREFYETVTSEGYKLVKQEDGSLVMEVGPQAWPFSVPLKNSARGWYFDTPTGIDELLNRRIGRNELSAVNTMNVLVEAQLDYASVDWDKDGVLEYAQLFTSSPGKLDGLFWEQKDTLPVSPLTAFVEDASMYINESSAGDPVFKGYKFKILFSQGKDNKGGAYDYIVNGNMISGFAILAYPAEYASTGVMSFMVSHEGDIFETDLGDETQSTSSVMSSYNPDDSWILVEE